MNFPGNSLLERAEYAVRALESVQLDSSEIRSIDDAAIIRLTVVAARARELATTLGAVAAGEIAERSSSDRGSNGLAQRTGFRTPEELVKSSTRSSGREAVTAVRVGRLLRDAGGHVDPESGELRPPVQPWLVPAAVAVSSGQISVAALEAIRSGIGVPCSAVSAEQLAAACQLLVSEAAKLDPDRLFKRARATRDELDLAGVALREEERRQQRSLRLTALPTGMGRLVWTMPPETLAAVKDLYDRMTSPKLGGVRFVDDRQRQLSDDLMNDERSPEQLTSDGFEQLLRLGADADPAFLIGSGAPVVIVTTTDAAYRSGEGVGRVEGQSDPVGMTTIDRLVCTGRVMTMTFDPSGQPIDVGREQRLFTKRQRRALAVRDGGCRAPGCDRPPSWTEAHHVESWARDHGSTDIANGILLCRHHHLLFHNNGWRIERGVGAEYWLIPPESVDPMRSRRAMPTKSLAVGDLQKVALKSTA
jgi:hypothetical protein